MGIILADLRADAAHGQFLSFTVTGLNDGSTLQTGHSHAAIKKHTFVNHQISESEYLLSLIKLGYLFRGLDLSIYRRAIPLMFNQLLPYRMFAPPATDTAECRQAAPKGHLPHNLME